MNLRGNPRSSTLVCRAQNMLEFREGPDQKQKGWGFDEETDDYKEFYPGSIHELSPPEALSPSLLPVNSLPILTLLAHSRLLAWGCHFGFRLWNVSDSPLPQSLPTTASLVLLLYFLCPFLRSFSLWPGWEESFFLENPNIQVLQQACKVQRKTWGERMREEGRVSRTRGGVKPQPSGTGWWSLETHGSYGWPIGTLKDAQ